MNTHQRWAQKMMRNEGRPIRDIEKEAADRERRRIRRAQRDWIARVRLVKPVLADLLDAATRAKRSKRK